MIVEGVLLQAGPFIAVGFVFIVCIFFLNVLIFNWRIIALQCCIGFSHTTVWISQEYTTASTSHPYPPLLSQFYIKRLSSVISAVPNRWKNLCFCDAWQKPTKIKNIPFCLRIICQGKSWVANRGRSREGSAEWGEATGCGLCHHGHPSSDEGAVPVGRHPHDQQQRRKARDHHCQGEWGVWQERRCLFWKLKKIYRWFLVFKNLIAKKPH